MPGIFLLSPWVDMRYKMAITSLKLIKYYLADHGYQAEIIDCAYYPRDLEEVVARVRASGPRPVVGVTGYTRERFYAYELIRKVRSAVPDALIVVGGRHFGFLAEETLTELPEVDAVVRGEGEVTFKEICDRAAQGLGFEGVDGLSCREGGRVVHNPDRNVPDDLDLFRVYDPDDPASLEPGELLGHTKIDFKNSYFPVHATRGCPNKCVYCSLTASKVRFRSIDNILREIEDKIRATGVRYVSFTDSSLTINRHFVTDLCNAIMERGLDIRWRCYSRVNIDIELLRLMRKAGLDSVEIGLETGSPKILKSIRKNIKHDEVRSFVRLARELGIKVWVFCMVSLPDETYEDARMTLDFVREIAPYITNTGLQTCRITPDAALCAMARERGVLPADFSWFEPYETPLKELTRPWDASLPIYVEHLTIPQIQQVHDEFKRILSRDLADLSVFWQGVKYNLSPRGLKRLTPRLLAKKAVLAADMFYHAVRNRLRG